jgi:hypothetical protein
VELEASMSFRRLSALPAAAAALCAVFGLVAVAPAATASGSAAKHSAVTHRGTAQAMDNKTGLAAGVPFCKKLAKGRLEASLGVNMYCFGPRRSHAPGSHAASLPVGQAAVPRNVDAANPAEDVSPAGVPAEGQEETSIAAGGRYVVEVWNDATGSFSPCPSPMYKEETTGFGFSANGGKSFTDLGGLPNRACRNYLYWGDPSVTAYQAGGHTYFYISSIYLPQPALFSFRPFKVAMAVCTVLGSAATATLRCSQPVIEASSTQCATVKVHHKVIQSCSLIDKDYTAIDPAHGKLYVAYTEFLNTGSGAGQEELAVCDLGNHHGGRGPAGGTPAAPVCEHGSPLVPRGKHFRAGKPYLTVGKQDPRGCENEGSYPAVDSATGNVFTGYEYNWGTSDNGLGGSTACYGAKTPVSEVLTKAPARCLTLTDVSPCAGPSATVRVPIVSMQGTLVPGYDRGGGNDFPRLAVSDRYHTVSMVWNDARYHRYGDILLQSFSLGSLRPVQARPVVLDRPHHGGLSFLPGLRMADTAGRLDVSWYSRPSVDTTRTSVEAAIGVSPRATATPPNVKITNVASVWGLDSSDGAPNFGDYTDNTISVTGRWPYTGNTLYIAWTDGRLGFPQPFAARVRP